MRDVGRIGASLAFQQLVTHVVRMSKIGIAVAALLAAAAMAVAYSAWKAMADVTMSPSGYIAMILGAVAAFAIGGGLMALLFWSNRKGFDDAAGARPRFQQDERPQKE